MEKHPSFSLKRTKFFIFSLTISFSIIILTLFSFSLFKSDTFIITPQADSISPTFIPKPFDSNPPTDLVETVVNLSQTHFGNPLNSSKPLNVSLGFDGLERKSGGSERPNMGLYPIDGVNATEFVESHVIDVNSSVINVNVSNLKSIGGLIHTIDGVDGSDVVELHVNSSVVNVNVNVNVSSLKSISDGVHKIDGVNGTEFVELHVNSSVMNMNVSSLKSISDGVQKIGGKQSERLCDVTKGKWVYDDSYPLYTTFTCPFIDEGFDCEANGRLDKDYMKWRWQPQDCDVPRFNATNMLELIRGKRLVFVGDSINRNQWESMLCLLMSAVKDPKRVYETHGRRITKEKGNYCFKFVDYKCTVEYYVSHFLVHEGKARVGRKRLQTLRIDTVDRGSSRWKGADVLIFNTAHWWNHYKTRSGVNYYQEGDNVLPRLDATTAFRKSMTTWASWVDKYINPRKTQVVFRSSAPSHFKGGEWNAGGHCKEASRPLNRPATSNHEAKNVIVEEVINQMKTRVKLLNITNLSDYRIDGHPSIYGRKGGDASKGEDCSHWCLPGVPDVWNQILYVHLQSMVRKNRHIQ